MTVYVDRCQIPGWGSFWIGIIDGQLGYLKLPPEHSQEALPETEVPGELEDFAAHWNLTLVVRRVGPAPEVWGQLRQYLGGTRQQFQLPLKLLGTDFQKQVWQALLAIPWGEARTYRDIAIALGNCRLARAVGQANGRNPVSIVVPCHRVVAKDGLGGYTGGLGLKQRLLQIEGTLKNIAVNGKGRAV